MRILGKQSLQSVLAGVLAGLAWEPFGIWPLAIVGWTWWFSTLRSGDQRQLFLSTLLFALSTWAIAFHWVALHPIAMASSTSVVALIAYASILSALVAVLVTRAPVGATRIRLLAGVLAVLVFEVIISWGPFAMPWLSASLALAPSDWSLQLFSWMGLKGGSAALMITAALAADLVVSWQADQGEMAVARSGSSRAIPLGVLLLLPFWPLNESTIESGDSVRIQIAQPDASPQEWAQISNYAKIDTFESWLAEANLKGAPVELTVLPETALPIGSPDSLRSWAIRLERTAKSPVLTGGIEVAPSNPEVENAGNVDATALNVAYLSSDTSHRHAKIRLVPFAERVPFSNLIPGFQQFAVPSGGVSAYVPGDRRPLLALNPASSDVSPEAHQIVPLICFESLFFRDAREGLLGGGSFTAVMTQDGWWGSSLPKAQHLAFSRALAAATGRALIHTTVDGNSALIDASGALIPLGRRSPRLLTGDLPLAERDTLFMRVGNALFFGIFGALAVVYAILAIRHQSSNRSSPVSGASP